MKHQSTATWLAATLFAPLVLASCTSIQDANEPRGAAAFADDPRLGEEVRSVCFASTIDSFQDATDDTVIIEAGVNRHYLVEVFANCHDLRYAQSIGIDTALSCITRSDYLIVSDSAFSLNDSSGIGPQRCLITGLYDWDEDAEESVEEDVEQE